MFFSYLLKGLRSYFFYGLIIIVPVAATMFIVYIALQFLVAPLGEIYGDAVSPFLSLLVSLGIITGIGFLSRHFIGRFLLEGVEALISKLPIINRVYDSSKHIMDVFSGKQRQEIKPVLVEYPKKEMWAIGFMTRSTLRDLDRSYTGSDELVSVFIPTTPNPTSGYMVYVDKQVVKPLNIGFEEAIKTLISAGVVASK
tara:strand:+ start:302 stop:895 length:594 start_codon:yes stop_codon:yes gene_type:complete